MFTAVSQDDEIQLLAEQEHPGDTACGQGCFGAALERHRVKWQLFMLYGTTQRGVAQ